MGYPRTRSKGSIASSSTGTKTSVTTCSDAVSTSSYSSAGKVGEIILMDDIVTPGFKKIVAAGGIVNTPMTRVRTTCIKNGNFGSRRKKNYFHSSCQSHFDHYEYDSPYTLSLVQAISPYVMDQKSLLDASSMNSIVSLAATDAWADANGHTASVLQDIAEIHQLVRLLKDPLSLAQFRMDRVARDLNEVRRRAKTVAEIRAWAERLWLSYRFGVRPLISTVKGVLTELGNKDRTRHRFTSRGQSSSYATSSVSSYVLGPESTIADYSVTYSDEVLARCGILTEREITIAQSLGVDASGILALPWELLPYSFVADWFANVGDFLYGLTPYTSLSPIAMWTTITRTRTATFAVPSTRINGTTYVVTEPISDSHVYVEETLQRVPSCPGPSITFRPGSLGQVCSDLRFLDGFALISQRIAKL